MTTTVKLTCFLVWGAIGVAGAHSGKRVDAMYSYFERRSISYGHDASIGRERWHTAYQRNTQEMDRTEKQSTGVSSPNMMRTLTDTINTDAVDMAEVTKYDIRHVTSTHISVNGASIHRGKSSELLSHNEEKHPQAHGTVEKQGDRQSYTRAPRRPIRLVNLLRERRLNHRHKRGTRDSPERITGDGDQTRLQSVQATSLSEPFTEKPDTVLEAMPKPQAQNQSTAFPFDFTRNYEFFTFPDDDFEESTTLMPIATRSKDNVVKNPFYPVTSESYGAYAILCVSVIIFTVGIIGNIAIMCIVCHNYYMRSISNSLLANLALWDFVVIFFCLPLVIFHELTKDWLLGEFSCKIIPYIEVASLGVTTFTLCALCIDRFRAATNVQMYYEMIENCTSTAAKLAVIWIGALLLALPELLIRQLVREEQEPPEVTPCERCVVRISTELPDTLYVLGLTYDGARLWWYFGCYFCLPTLFTIISSLVTAKKIRRAERASVRANRKQIQLEGQMNCMVVAMAIVYGFCIIPENICNIVSVYMAVGVPRRTLDILHLVSQILLFCKSAATPVLLLALCRPFSRAFLDCCCCCCEECGPPKSSTATSDDNEQECTTELELSPFSTIRREVSTYTPVSTHC